MNGNAVMHFMKLSAFDHVGWILYKIYFYLCQFYFINIIIKSFSVRMSKLITVWTDSEIWYKRGDALWIGWVFTNNGRLRNKVLQKWWRQNKTELKN